jgi:hypothetical protein
MVMILDAVYGRVFCCYVYRLGVDSVHYESSHWKFYFCLCIVGTSFHIYLIFTISCVSQVILLDMFNFCRYASFAGHPDLVNNIVSQAK